jgi:hypothetical protein
VHSVLDTDIDSHVLVRDLVTVSKEKGIPKQMDSTRIELLQTYEERLIVKVLARLNKEISKNPANFKQ